MPLSFNLTESAWRTRSHIYNPWDWVAQLYPQALGTHAWTTVGLFFNAGHQRGLLEPLLINIFFLTLVFIYYLTTAYTCADACTAPKATLCSKHSTLFVFESYKYCFSFHHSLTSRVKGLSLTEISDMLEMKVHPNVVILQGDEIRMKFTAILLTEFANKISMQIQ